MVLLFIGFTESLATISGGYHITLALGPPTIYLQLPLDANGDEESFSSTGNGNGGFITIDANAVAPGVVVDVKTFGGGKGAGHDGVAGPGAEKAGAKACDGRGIDYIEACFGAE